MLDIITLAASGTLTALGYLQTRSFVRRRLRFVDAVQKPSAPFLAGIGAVALAAPVVGVLPLVGAGTALLFGVGVGAGVRAGVKEIRRGRTFLPW